MGSSPKHLSLILPIFILLAACGRIVLPTQVATREMTPSPPPAILSPTSPFAPSATFTPSGTPTASEPPTATLTASPTETPAAAFSLLVEISACNTSLDLTHGMGEVTNAYPLLKNYTSTDLTNVCATLSASDEAREHPDKTACVPVLPARKQVLLKLTVDTGFQVDTSIQVGVTSQEGPAVSVTAPSCAALGWPGRAPEKLGVIEPIP